MALIFGDNGNNDINGTINADSIFAQGGNDTINGSWGNDAINGGSGVDMLDYSNGLGSMTINLATGQATSGWFGTDTLVSIEEAQGAAGDDSITGNGQDNELRGNDGDDTLIGGAGDDSLYGGNENDLMIGTSGSNYYDPGNGDDTVNGGTGNDFIFSSAGDDVFNGGAGHDIGYYALTLGAINANLATGIVQDGQGGTDTVSSIEEFYAGLGNDVIVGSSAAEIFFGGAGNDAIAAGAGADTFLGSDGDDTFDGGAGIDWIDNTGGGIIDILDSQYWIYRTGDAQNDVYANIEGIKGTGNVDLLGGDAGMNGLDGEGGDDELFGLAGTDYLFGGDGNDLLNGGKGGDWLDGQDGIDTASYLKLGSGAVTASLLNSNINKGDAAGDSYISVENLEGSYGSDVLEGDNNDNTLMGVSGNDTLRGQGGDDTLDGGAGGDVMIGGSGFDYASYESSGAGVTAVLINGYQNYNTGHAAGDSYTGVEGLIGSAGNDALYGNHSANELIGGAGNDVLSGLNGGDTLIGGDGNDTLRGDSHLDGSGTGDDTFIFSTGDDIDRIQGFEAGAGSDDVILLELGLAFNTFAEVNAVKVGLNGGVDTLLNFGGGDAIILEGVAPSDIHSNDFIFA